MKKFTILLTSFTFLMLSSITSAQIKDMDVPYTEFSYNNNSCSGYQSATGSLIFIPADAFLTEDGNICKGKITVKYRELHTRGDMLVSGINMILFKEGKRKMLESAGMFELYGECNGNTVRLNPGKTIQVRMKCLRELKNLKVYKYDQQNKFWTDTDIPIIDFSFRKNDNNQENLKLWGSNSVGNSTRATNLESDVNLDWDSIRIASLNNIFGSLPEGYFKGINIKETGLYNYDAVIKDENAVSILANFILSTGEKIDEKIYVSYNKKNMLICYYPTDMKENFVLLPEKETKIFCLFKDGSTAMIKEGELEKINLEHLRGKEFTFIMEKQPAKPKDKLSLCDALKIK